MFQVLTGEQKPAQALRSELTSQPGRQTISKQMGDSSEHRLAFTRPFTIYIPQPHRPMTLPAE